MADTTKIANHAGISLLAAVTLSSCSSGKEVKKQGEVKKQPNIIFIILGFIILRIYQDSF